MNTGSPQLGRPAMGAWVTYGLGSEVDDLPGFVVLHSGGGRQRRRAQLGLRLHADALPGRALPRPGRSRAERGQSAKGVDARCSATASTSSTN
jgi:hypothetical protein